MKKLLPLAVALAAAATLLTACGGGGGDGFQPPKVATQNVTAPITAATVGAVAGETFAFNSGVSALGTASATTLTINAPANGSTVNTFAVASAEGSANGNLRFGSCIFEVTQSTYPAGSPLAAGQSPEVEPCQLNVPVAGMSTDGGARDVNASFTLGSATSQPTTVSVDITDNGTVVVNGTTAGTTPTGTTTGGTGR